jgi:polyisoprenyl-teichoic acid--peptidoglycan teichoic acid transferase
MADGEKPYRLYRGGRVKGRVPLGHRPERAAKPRPPQPPRADGAPPGAPQKPEKPRKPANWRRRIGIGAAVLFLFLVAWLVAGYLAFRSGVHAANDRLPRSARKALTTQHGLLLSRPTHILLLGTDHSANRDRSGLRHSDSIMLVRSDPDHHRVVYLSIPRDLRVQVPGHGPDKINVAFQIGGAALTARTVRAYTGLGVNHVVLVDFASFKDLIDSIGGVTVDVPAPILSNRFDCPYSTPARCSRWPGWRFRKGKQRMDGKRALIYSRIRENRLNPRESDITRGSRQQQVLQALTGKLTGVGTFARLPFVGDELMKPLATDLTAGQFLQLGWIKFRGHTLHCRLGGTPEGIGGQSVLLPDEEAHNVIQMVLGRTAPQPPLPGAPFGSGCLLKAGR